MNLELLPKTRMEKPSQAGANGPQGRTVSILSTKTIYKQKQNVKGLGRHPVKFCEVESER